MSRTDALRDLARRQHGVVSRRQLHEIGFDRAAVTRLVATGKVERISPRVLRMAGSTTTAQQRAIAAALDANGAVAFESAAAMWDLPGFMLHPLQVLATRTPHRDLRRVGRMHSSVRLHDEDITTLNGVPVTTPLRTLRDLAGRLHPQRLSNVCDRMLSTRLLRLPALRTLLDELPARGGAPGTAEMRKLILSRPDDYRPADSNLERRFETILDEAGEEPFERQIDVGDDEGWIGRVDFLDRRCRVIVEVQSHLFHTGMVDVARDAVRFRRLRAAGWIVVEVTDHDIWYRKAHVVDQIRRARAHLPSHPKVARSASKSDTD